MKKYKLIISFLLCLVFIYLVNLFTQEPGSLGGNGNLGLIPLFFAILVFLLFGITFIQELKKLRLQRNRWIFILLVSLIALTISSFLEIHFFHKLIEQLGGPPSDVDSDIYRFGWLNQGTNTLFMNIYIFVSFIALLAAIFATYTIFRLRQSKHL